MEIRSKASNSEDTKDVARRGLSFGLLRGASNATWIGGTAISITAQEKLGVPWQLAAPAVTGTVTGIELYGSAIARRIFGTNETISNHRKQSSRWNQIKGIAGRATREAFSLGYSAWSGAMSAVEINNLLDLETTPKRSAVQSVTYGAGVGVWSLPVTRDAALETIHLAQEHPVPGLIGGLATAALFVGVMEKGKHAWQNYKTEHETQHLERSAPQPEYIDLMAEEAPQA